MYEDEFERAVTGKSTHRGLSPLAWIGVSLGVALLLGGVGVGYAVTSVAHRASQVAHDLQNTRGVAAARLLSRLEGSTSLVALDPDAGLAFLRGLPQGDPTKAVVENVVGSDFDPADQPQAVGNSSDDDVGSLTIHSDDGDVHIGLTRRKNGGALRLDSPDGHVHLDLTKNARGGFLTIDSDDGHARIDFIRDEGGGRLVVRSQDDRVDLAIGPNSGGPPAWVPRPKGMPDGRPAFSLRSDDALLGAVAWEDAAAPGELVSAYRQTLEGEGYEVEAEHSRRSPGRDEASLWARRAADRHMVFLLARRTDGRTHEVLGYGAGDAADR